jgi:hypothetical protein
MQQLNKDAASAAKESPLPRFGKKSKGNSPAERLNNLFESVYKSCYLCRMTDNTFERYMDTFLYLWKKGGDEARLIEDIPGYCLPHFSELLKLSENLGKNKQITFVKIIIPTQLYYMGLMEDDLEWFTLKFDYRNANEPWKNAKDALPRAMAMLRGIRYEPD